MNIFAVIILIAILGEYLLSLASSILSLRTFSPTLPAEFRDVFDEDKYAQARHYSQTRTYFGFIHSSVDLIILLTFWFFGGFEWLDQVVRTAGYGPLVSGLVYIGSLTLASSLLGLPFRLYSTFVIEARFGFNRTTVGTFASDLLKGLVLGVVLGGLLLAVVLLFFEWAGPLAWLWCWLAATAFMLAIQFVAPTWIMPIFNKFTALDDGELHDAIVITRDPQASHYRVSLSLTDRGDRQKRTRSLPVLERTSVSVSSIRLSMITQSRRWLPSLRMKWATTRNNTL